MPVQLQTLVQASFEEMNDSLDPQTGSERKAKLLQNVYPVDADRGGGLTGRPGFFLSSNTAIGVTAHTTFQRFYQFTKLDGTEYTVGFCGGKMYTYSWASSAWTNVALAASVGLTADIAIYCTTYNNTMVVQPNDGVNKPWTWDGTTFTSLTSAPFAFGPPTVYYAKLFFIEWTNRNTIDWSEENAANTGYQAGGYLNFWQLTQTDPNALYAIRGTNEALYYWRARSMGRILGAVTPTFTSDGTHDAVSLTTGTESPNSITDDGTDIFFLDADGRPHVLQSGGQVSPFWKGYRNTIKSLPRADLPNALGATFSPIPLVLFQVQELGESQPNLTLTIRPAPDAKLTGLWRGWAINAMDMVKNGSGIPTLMIGGNDGYAYIVSDPDTGTVWDDQLQSGTVPIQHYVYGSFIGYDTKANKQFDRARVIIRPFTSTTNIGFAYESPTVSETLTPQSPLMQSGSLWDQDLWDSAQWNSLANDAVVEWGIQGYGRYLLPKVSHQALGEQFGLNVIEVDAYVSGVDPVEV